MGGITPTLFFRIFFFFGFFTSIDGTDSMSTFFTHPFDREGAEAEIAFRGDGIGNGLLITMSSLELDDCFGCFS